MLPLASWFGTEYVARVEAGYVTLTLPLVLSNAAKANTPMAAVVIIAAIRWLPVAGRYHCRMR